MRKVLCLLFGVALLPGKAETTISDVVVNQRWPWSEKVDVDFTLTGENSDVDVYATCDQLRNDGASPLNHQMLLGTILEAKPGHHRFTWDPSASRDASGCWWAFKPRKSLDFELKF